MDFRAARRPSGAGEGVRTVSDPDLEVVIWQRDEARKAGIETAKEIARLRASNVELLAAAKKGRDVILETEGRGGRHEVILTQIEQAISNAEKGT